MVESHRAFARVDTGARLSDTFKNLRVSLLTMQHRRPTVIVITTAQHGGEPPVSVAGLAMATASSNLRTVVVEGVDSHLRPGLPSRLAWPTFSPAARRWTRHSSRSVPIFSCSPVTHRTPLMISW